MVALLISGCKTTKFVPDDRYLLSDIDIKVDNDQINKEELSTYVRQKENMKILGMLKFHLWLYNLSRKNKEEGLLKKIGEPPVIYDLGLKDKTVQQFEQYLYNKGYYQAVVNDTVCLKKKKAQITYRVKTGEPYLLRNITYRIDDQKIAALIHESNDETLLISGNVFDVDLLQKERARIALEMKNKGYFNFAEEYIHYQVDTTLYHKRADIEIILENAGTLNVQNTGSTHKKYEVSDYSIYVGSQKKNVEMGEVQAYSDTTKYDGYTIYHNGKLPLKESLFFKSIEIKPGELYSKKGEDKTYNNLYALRQFKYVNIQYHQEGGDSLLGFLKGRIFLPMQVKQNYSVDVEGTNTSGNMGVAGNLNYQHRNLFHGAEIFDITLKGATERELTLIDDLSTEFNTREFGGTMKLTIPGFLQPFSFSEENLYSMPFTSFSTSYNYQERPDYTRTIINATLGYSWKTQAYYTHNFNLMDLNAVRIFSIDSDFLDDIEDLYIKSSYIDHIISSSNYSFTFNDQSQSKRTDYHYFKMKLEAAGNVLRVINSLIGSEKFTVYDDDSLTQSSYYKIFDTRYAQYVKGDFEFRYGYRFDKYNLVATRLFAGVALPYGNFNVIPFEKRYYTGGANGIRAWQVKSLGPGSYVAATDEYPNQSADIKLEANIEYRFKLFWIMEGALFVDAGNIWAINDEDTRDGALFHFDKFYNEFAIGTGLGLRLVTSYFILRADLGVKVRDPSLDVGKRWIPTNRAYDSSDLNFNIAIGYPF
jgi:outer membrane protein assembly factor BamA